MAPRRRCVPTATVELNYNGDGFSGTIPSSYGELTAITYFDLGENELTGTIPTELALLTAITTGGDINGFLGCNSGLVGTLPTQLGQLTNIQSRFSVERTQVTGTVPTQVSRFA